MNPEETSQQHVAELKARIAVLEEAAKVPRRRRLPDVRSGVTHKFSVADHEGYVTVGFYPDGTPGELFIAMAKEGSTISGLMDTVARMASVTLQYGVPVDVLADKFIGQRFEPMGWTANPKITPANSIPDYIFRWLKSEFGEEARAAKAPKAVQTEATPVPDQVKSACVVAQ